MCKKVIVQKVVSHVIHKVGTETIEIIIVLTNDGKVLKSESGGDYWADITPHKDEL